MAERWFIEKIITHSIFQGYYIETCKYQLIVLMASGSEGKHSRGGGGIVD